MSKPTVHAKSSAAHFGGKAEDYLPIHKLLDSSKGTFPDLRHRALTHNSWFITEILPRIFGEEITNSKGQKVSVRDIAERHVLEDFGNLFIPAPSDFLAEIEFHPWMDNALNGTTPPSHRKLGKYTETLPERPIPEHSIVIPLIVGEVPGKNPKVEDKENSGFFPRPRRGCSGGPPGTLD